MKKGVRSRKKSSGGIHIHLTNRWLYSLIAFGIVLVAVVGVYALTPGVAPANGHVITNVAPPSGCGSGTYLEWTGSAWACASTTETDPVFTNWVNSHPNFYPYDVYASGSIGSSGGFSLGYNSVVSWGDYSQNVGVLSGSSCNEYYSLAACYSNTNYHGVCACISQNQAAGTWKFVA